MPNSVSTIYRYQGAKGGSQMAVQAALSNAEPIQGVAQQQIVASYSQTVLLDIPAMPTAGYTSISQRIPLTTFPTSILIPANVRAFVMAGATISGAVPTVMVGAAAPALYAGVQPIPFQLVPGTTYRGLSLIVTIPLLSFAPSSPAYPRAPFAVWALLVCSR